MKDRFRQHRRSRGIVAQMHGDRVAVDRGFRRDPQLSLVRQDQQAALGAPMLDRGAHDRHEEPLPHECA